MRYNAEEEGEDVEDFLKNAGDYDSFKFAIDFNKNKIIDSNEKEVADFLEFLLENILDKIDQIKEPEISSILSSFVSIGIGAMGEAILELKEKNSNLVNEIELGDLDQNPELN
jgi:hypothetical protein